MVAHTESLRANAATLSVIRADAPMLHTGHNALPVACSLVGSGPMAPVGRLIAFLHLAIRRALGHHLPAAFGESAANPEWIPNPFNIVKKILDAVQEPLLEASAFNFPLLHADGTGIYTPPMEASAIKLESPEAQHYDAVPINTSVARLLGEHAQTTGAESDLTIASETTVRQSCNQKA